MSGEKEQVGLGIVDDHNLFRKGLIKLIHLGDKESRYKIIFEAANGTDLKEKLDKRQLPDIILMDIDMPETDGYEAVEWLKKNYPEINVLVISMFETEQSIIKMLRYGVKGYLSKDIEVEDIHMALEAIINKGFYYSDTVTGAMAHSIQINDTDSKTKMRSANDLSDHEKDFIKFSCSDMTYQEIAEKMHLSPKTIDGYRDALFKRFNVKSRVGLAMYAVKNGLFKL
ncbi:MAG: response regulator transcription factor [Chitinophagaceae bacterium]